MKKSFGIIRIGIVVIFCIQIIATIYVSQQQGVWANGKFYSMKESGEGISYSRKDARIVVSNVGEGLRELEISCKNEDSSQDEILLKYQAEVTGDTQKTIKLQTDEGLEVDNAVIDAKTGEFLTEPKGTAIGNLTTAETCLFAAGFHEKKAANQTFYVYGLIATLLGILIIFAYQSIIRLCRTIEGIFFHFEKEGNPSEVTYALILGAGVLLCLAGYIATILFILQ